MSQILAGTGARPPASRCMRAQGAWRDVGWWQLDLDPDAGDPPEEPLTPGYH